MIGKLMNEFVELRLRFLHFRKINVVYFAICRQSMVKLSGRKNNHSNLKKICFNLFKKTAHLDLFFLRLI